MWDWLSQAQTLQREGIPFAVVTVVGCVGSTPREVGAKMLVQADGRSWGTVGGGKLEALALADARACLDRGQTRTFRYPLGPKAGQCCGGAMDVLVETVNAGPRLFLFGAGHVAQALCQVLAETPFTVELVDEREEWLTAPGLPASVARHAQPWEDFVAKARWSAERTYVAVMTHRHDVDQEILAHVLQRPTRYVGMIGSVTKWRRFQPRLLERGIPEAQLKRVRCPIGLAIGGKSPREVAISIAAELLQMHHAGGEADTRPVPNAPLVPDARPAPVQAELVEAQRVTPSRTSLEPQPLESDPLDVLDEDPRGPSTSSG